jgi:hypothetical protein
VNLAVQTAPVLTVNRQFDQDSASIAATVTRSFTASDPSRHQILHGIGKPPVRRD